MNNNNRLVLSVLSQKEGLSSSEIQAALQPELSLATVKRLLQGLVKQGWVEGSGKGKSTRYLLTDSYRLLFPVDVDKYFSKETDERTVTSFSQSDHIFRLLSETALFNAAELKTLEGLQNHFREKSSSLPDADFQKEMERLAIDLSWKSSQIEGNTYSLLETELLLKNKLTASGKTKDEAVMLLNHKEAIDFIADHPDYMNPLKVPAIEDIHSMLIKDLGVSRNLRKRAVGISGTNYRPPDNEHQIREALQNTCELVNAKSNVFEKSLLALALISWIQPFGDGNKRTARITCNALLMHHHHCPLSFRTVDSLDYKKAMLVFYEMNNISAIKSIFINQYEFAVKTYF